MLLLVELVEALSRAHTEVTWAHAAAGVLGRHLPLRSFEAVLDDRRVVVSVRRGKGSTITLPLAGGHLRLIVGPGAPPSGESMEGIARVLSAALHQVRTFARAGDVARRAHGQSRELAARIKE